MPVPIIYLDGQLRHFAEQFRELFSKLQFKYLVTVLLGLILAEGARTLVGLRRPSLSGLSRFLPQAPWEAAAMAEQWLKRVRETMQPLVHAEQQCHRLAQLKRRGRPKTPVVTGYLIEDDSTIQKRKGKKPEYYGASFCSFCSPFSLTCRIHLFAVAILMVKASATSRVLA